MCTKKIEHTFDRKEVCIMIIEKDLGGYFKYVVIGDDVLVDPVYLSEYMDTIEGLTWTGL